MAAWSRHWQCLAVPGGAYLYDSIHFTANTCAYVSSCNWESREGLKFLPWDTLSTEKPAAAEESGDLVAEFYHL